MMRKSYWWEDDETVEVHHKVDGIAVDKLLFRICLNFCLPEIIPQSDLSKLSIFGQINHPTDTFPHTANEKVPTKQQTILLYFWRVYTT